MTNEFCYTNFTIDKESKRYTSSSFLNTDDCISSVSQYFSKSKCQWENQKSTIDSSSVTKTLSVYDVAAYILNKIGSVTTMKLQKLVYYCQAWSLVWDENILFKEQIEAWANGPVVRDLFTFHRGMFRIESIPIGNPDLLSEAQKETVDAVIEFYGKMPSQELIDLTHSEAPWKNARKGLAVADRGCRVISIDDMAEYYSSLPPSAE